VKHKERLTGWTVWSKKRGFGSGLEYPQAIYATRDEARRKAFTGDPVVRIVLHVRKYV
jgi:hypothetical protein